MKAFTLIEILLVFAVAITITTISVNMFSSYNRSQVFETGVSEFTSFLSFTRSRALSQVKPSVCGSGTLEGYRVVVIPYTGYEQAVMCGGSIFTTVKKKLPNQLSFMDGSLPNVDFGVSTGTVAAPGSIAITGFGKTTTVAVNKFGNTSTSSGSQITPIPTPTPTVGAATPTPTPTPEVSSTEVVVSSSPNPSTFGSNVTFSATVTGTNCIPSIGSVIIYIDGAVATSVTVSTIPPGNPNQKTGSRVYTHSPATRLTVAGSPHQIRGMYVGAGCPSNVYSPYISHIVNP